jgi:ligand-binding SRPBCC domain-containing protein
VPTIELTTYVAAPPQTCFDHALDVDVQVRLDAATRVVGGVTTGRLEPGNTVTWRAVHFLLPWRMTSQIVSADPPRTFVDSMLRGPFSHWTHTHRFEVLTEGTAVHDHVEYGVPLGSLGRLFDAVVLNRYLTGLLAARNQRFKGIAEGSLPASE